MTTLTLKSVPLPLRVIENGTIRIGDSRIPLERVVRCYLDGYTPETIVDAYDTLRLADVYAVIGYYLDHREEVQDYMRQQEELAEEIRRKIEALQPPRPGLREELLARRARLEANHAASGQ